jgi:glycosyltransferase involved in cell wall biosynthesis
MAEKVRALVAAGEVAPESRGLFVDDGSKDNTWGVIENLTAGDETYRGVKLSRNRGHQNALLAGLHTAKDYADIIISLDADLQDDINAIDQMVAKYKQGYEVIYGVRSERKTDSFFKKHTAQAFYKIMLLLGVNIVYNHADYRLMSKRAVEALGEFTEVNLFLRGMVPLVGFKSASVEYQRAERVAGESKYPLKKMLSFAWDGITSFSIRPIRLVLGLGVIFFIVGAIVALYSLIRWATGHTISGWTFLSLSIWIASGVQMISLGLIGEYIGKIYSETKRRPSYIIETVL